MVRDCCSWFGDPCILNYDSQSHVFLPSAQDLVSPNFSRVKFGFKRVGSGEESVGGGNAVEKCGGGVDGFVNVPNFSRVNLGSKWAGSGDENAGGGDLVEKGNGGGGGGGGGGGFVNLPKFSRVNFGSKWVGSGEENVGGGNQVENGGGGGGGGFVNLPNLISMGRLISGLVIGWMILQEMYVPAFGCLAVSGATDWVDGYVARKLRINSVVGSYLDPLADKVLIGLVALAMVGIIVLRDVALVGGAIYNRASSLNCKWKSWSDFFNLDGINAWKVEPLFISKVNTVFQLVLVTAALLQPDLGTQDTESYIIYLSWFVASTTVAYGAQHLRRKPLLRKSF